MAEPSGDGAGPAVTIAADHLSVAVGAVEIARYVFRPVAPVTESVKPYVFPLRSLRGAPLSAYRPWDHRWHKGLQLTLSHLSGENFWGGPTFDPTVTDPPHGYVQRDNNGRQRHEGFDLIAGGDAAPPGEAIVRERLTWLTAGGRAWLAERRTLRVHGVDPAADTWALDVASRLTNLRDRPLVVGSPTTLGRPRAGYTGLFWRGPRAWTGGDVLTPAGPGDEDGAMGSTGEWLAVAGDHDEIDGGGTVLMFAGRSSAPVPVRWFVRTGAFPALCPSPAFDTAFTLAPGATWALWHRVVLAGHRCDAPAAAALADRYRPGAGAPGPESP
ncbi:PmoA family protein [Nakamurella sp.]|uniref:DUF6807 domain-containing protein n=1 Tax=Nakamurella sp. TaxID=1869182 RepID=UPI003B3BCE00